MTHIELFETLKKEAIEKYHILSPVVDAALALNKNPFDVQQAHQDENGNAIDPSLTTLIVRGEHGWVVVSGKSCSCKSETICVHRIAAWMHREIIIRPLAEASHVTPSEILSKYFEIKEDVK